MGNRKARELQLKQDREAEWQRSLTEPRHPSRDVAGFSIGELRMQLIICPSFDEAQAWDVRGGPEEWRLYRSQVVQTYPEVILLGYERVPFESAVLSAFFEKVISFSLPLSPMNGGEGFDGTTFEFAVFGDSTSSWRFHWWSNYYPPQWRPLIEVVDEITLAISGKNLNDW